MRAERAAVELVHHVTIGFGTRGGEIINAERTATGIAQNDLRGFAGGKTHRVGGVEAGGNERCAFAAHDIVQPEELRETDTCPVAGGGLVIAYGNAVGTVGCGERQLAIDERCGAMGREIGVQRIECVLNRGTGAHGIEIERRLRDERAIRRGDPDGRLAGESEPIGGNQPAGTPFERIGGGNRGAAVGCGVERFSQCRKHRAELIGKAGQYIVAQVDERAQFAANGRGIDLVAGRRTGGAVGIGETDIDRRVERLLRARADRIAEHAQTAIEQYLPRAGIDRDASVRLFAYRDLHQSAEFGKRGAALVFETGNALADRLALRDRAVEIVNLGEQRVGAFDRAADLARDIGLKRTGFAVELVQQRDRIIHIARELRHRLRRGGQAGHLGGRTAERIEACRQARFGTDRAEQRLELTKIGGGRLRPASRRRTVVDRVLEKFVGDP